MFGYKNHLVFLAICLPFISFSQWVKEDDSSKVWLKDGIYLKQEDFLKNKPRYTWRTFDSDDWRELDSLRRANVVAEIHQIKDKRGFQISQRKFLGISNDSSFLIERRDIWGVCINGEAYRQVVRTNFDNFIYIPVTGTISYLTYTVTYEDPFYWSSEMMNLQAENRSENVDLIIDFEGLDITRNTRSALEDILRRDEELYREYEKEKKKSKAIYSYITRYNRRHPLNFDSD